MTFFRKQRRKLIGWLQKRAKGKSEDVWSVFKGVMYAYGLYYGSWLVVVLGGLAILSFTSWLGGPYVVAQVIFFLVAGTLAIILLNLFVFYRTLKGKWDDLQNSKRYREAKDVTETTNDDGPVREGRVIDSSDDG